MHESLELVFSVQCHLSDEQRLDRAEVHDQTLPKPPSMLLCHRSTARQGWEQGFLISGPSSDESLRWEFKLYTPMIFQGATNFR